jgi:hypothetical protein
MLRSCGSSKEKCFRRPVKSNDIELPGGEMGSLQAIFFFGRTT